MHTSDAAGLQPAYILHRRPYANSSLLLECFTASGGRFPAIARGGRTAALLQPFTPLIIAWRGRGEVKTITACEQDGALPGLAGRTLFCGFYLNELLMRLLGRSDSHGQLFRHYGETLHRLADGSQIDTCLRRFERLLLHELGYGLMLDFDAETGAAIDPTRRYRYQPETGPMPAQAQGFSVQGTTLLALAADQPMEGEATREARALMRHVLARYLGRQPLKSRELFQALAVKPESRQQRLSPEAAEQ